MAIPRPQALQQLGIVIDDGTNGQVLTGNTSGHANVVVQSITAGAKIIIANSSGVEVAVLDLTTNNALATAIVDSNGDQYATFPVSGTVTANVSDNATRDNGKIDIAALDQYTPITGRLPVDPSGVTSPVSLASVPSHAVTGPLTDTELRATAVPVSLASVPSHAVTNAGTFAVQDSTAQTSLAVLTGWDNAASDGGSVSGDVAHDSADAGEPVKIGFKAVSPDGTAPGTAVAENDRTNAKGDLDGRQYVNTAHPENFPYHYDSTSAVVTDGTVHADPGDGFAVFITDIVFSIGVATASSIFIEESTTKILGPYYLEAIAGRGLSLHFTTPKRCTASTAILVTTTGATTLSVDILGYVAAV